MKQLGATLFVICVLVSAAHRANGDAIVKPKAFHRQIAGTHRIETFINTGLKGGGKLSAAIYKKGGGVIQKYGENNDVPDCTPKMNGGEFCKDTSTPGRIKLVYQFTAPPGADEILFVNFAMTDDQNRDLGFFVDVKTDFDGVAPLVRPFERDVNVYTKAGPKKMMVEANAVIGIQVTNSNLKSLGAPDPNSQYRKQRIQDIFAWLATQKPNPPEIANVRVESRTGGKPVPYTLTSFAVFPEDVTQAMNDEGVTVYLIGTQDFPAEKFDIEVAFNNNPPLELSGSLTNTISGVSHIAAPSAEQVGKDKTLGARSLDTNLDLGVAFTSSVKDQKKDDKTVRERSNNGTLDLRFAPFLNLRLTPPQKLQQFITPIFLDAKVSTGKITEDTLSLNRIVFGTEYVIRYLQSTEEGKINKYIFSFSGNNASDRDFKRAEAKFTFQFQPIFNAINKPLKLRFKEPVPMSELIPDNGPKYVPEGWFGFQIQPSIGFEVGRTYRLRRDIFEGEELDRNVRRLIVGTDIILDLTRHVKVSLSDIYYVRGETPQHRGRNYFNAEIEAPIGSLGPSTAQSIFFSFERGDQPPFATPSVNALKIGYRIVSDPFGKRR
jgi:hypothetical protein